MIKSIKNRKKQIWTNKFEKKMQSVTEINATDQRTTKSIDLAFRYSMDKRIYSRLQENLTKLVPLK